MNYKKWQRRYPLVAKQKGRHSIEGVVVYTLERYFIGQWVSMSQEMDNALYATEDWLKHPRTEATKARSQAYLKRLGINYKID